MNTRHARLLSSPSPPLRMHDTGDHRANGSTARVERQQLRAESGPSELLAQIYGAPLGRGGVRGGGRRLRHAGARVRCERDADARAVAIVLAVERPHRGHARDPLRRGLHIRGRVRRPRRLHNLALPAQRGVRVVCLRAAVRIDSRGRPATRAGVGRGARGARRAGAHALRRSALLPLVSQVQGVPPAAARYEGPRAGLQARLVRTRTEAPPSCQPGARSTQTATRALTPRHPPPPGCRSTRSTSGSASKTRAKWASSQVRALHSRGWARPRVRRLCARGKFERARRAQRGRLTCPM